MSEISSAQSSPSLYSCAPSHAGHGSPRTLQRINLHRQGVLEPPSWSPPDDDFDYNHSDPASVRQEEDCEEDEEEIRRRLSLRGPVLRKYSTEAPWDELDDELGKITPRRLRLGRRCIQDTESICPSRPSTVVDTSGSPGTGWNGGMGAAQGLAEFGRQATKMMLRTAVGKTPKSQSSRSTSRSQSSSGTPPRALDEITSSTSGCSAAPSSASGNSFRRGFAQMLGKHLLPSSSGQSFSSAQSFQTASSDSWQHPITPKYDNDLGWSGKDENSLSKSLASSSDIETLNVQYAVHRTETGRNPRRGLGDPFNDSTTLGTSRSGNSITSPTRRTSIRTLAPPFSDSTKAELEVSGLSRETTPTLQSTSVFPHQDRPLVNSGSPAFQLISLEVARERELYKKRSPSGTSGIGNFTRSAYATTSTAQGSQSLEYERNILLSANSRLAKQKSTSSIGSSAKTCTTPATSPHPARALKGKKSGIMKLFNKGHHDKEKEKEKEKEKDNSNSINRKGMKIGDPISFPPPPTTLPSLPPLEMTNNALPEQGSKPRNTDFSIKQSPTDQSIDSLDDNPITTTTHQLPPNLQLRPMSMTFSGGLPFNYLSSNSLNTSTSQSNSPILEGNCEAMLETAINDLKVYPMAGRIQLNPNTLPNEADLPSNLREQIINARKGWQLQLFGLEAQIRELKDQLVEARNSNTCGGRAIGICETCGCSCGGGSSRLRIPSGGSSNSGSSGSVIDRARAKTGGARGVFGSGSLYEWE